MESINELWELFCAALWGMICSAIVLWMFLLPLALALVLVCAPFIHLWEKWQLRKWAERQRREAIETNEDEEQKLLDELQKLMSMPSAPDAEAKDSVDQDVAPAIEEEHK